MGNRLSGRVCIVTGAGQGIGRGSALELAREGGRIIVSDYKVEGALETVRMIEALGAAAHFVRCDVRSRTDIESLMAAAVERFGGIDVLHNNAGVHETDLTPHTALLDLPEEIWTQVYEVNLRSIWYATRAAAPHMKRSKAASIINTASISSHMAMPLSSAYCASKGGVLMLTKAIAVDLASAGIRCNCIAPGSIDTPLLRHYFDVVPDKAAFEQALLGANLIPRLGTPEDVGKLVCFLASDDSSYVTGSCFMVDAGVTAWRGTMDWSQRH